MKHNCLRSNVEKCWNVLFDIFVFYLFYVTVWCFNIFNKQNQMPITTWCVAQSFHFVVSDIT